MPSADRTPRRPLAKTGDRTREPFAALLRAAVEDAQAAQGLALAYAALETPERMRLIDAVSTDATTEQISASAVLASLLAVEEDATVARHIAASMSAAGAGGLACSDACKAMLCGDEHSGHALLARPLHGHFIELLWLRWEHGNGIVESAFEPLVHRDDVDPRARELDARTRAADSSRHLETMPLSFVVDVVTPVLWHHRRKHGELPPVVTRFADLFEPAPHPTR